MSHFAVLVVGDVDYNMAPFHEFECDGIDDEFIKDIDTTEECKESYRLHLEKYPEETKKEYPTLRSFIEGYYGYKFAESPDKVDKKGEHKWGYFYPVEGAEDDFKAFNRTNPDKFYDYYGDGYSGLRLKKPIKVTDWKTGEEKETLDTNHALKKDVDFEGKWAEEEQAARETYRKVIAALGYAPSLEHTWSSLVDKFCPDDGKAPEMTRDEADEIYQSQKPVRDWDELFKSKKLDRYELGFFSKVDDFCMTEDEYVASKSIHALTFGYVINREYHSRGRMGWWACVSNEKEPISWDEEFKKFIESLPDDAELTILDCHI